MLKDEKDPKNAYNELMAKDPMFWVKFVRRHKANYFDVHFHDNEAIGKILLHQIYDLRINGV